VGKGGRCVRLTILPPSCAVVMKYGNLNCLESSGQLQACNGTDLPFTITYYLHICYLFLVCVVARVFFSALFSDPAGVLYLMPKSNNVLSLTSVLFFTFLISLLVHMNVEATLYINYTKLPSP